MQAFAIRAPSELLLLLFIDSKTVDTGELFKQSYEYIMVVCWRKTVPRLKENEPDEKTS